MRRPASRRELLSRAAAGFGALAATALLAGDAAAADARPYRDPRNPNPLEPLHPQYPAKAKSVIFLFMDGGPSQVDTWDPKPLLERENGNPIKLKVPATQFDNVGAVLKSPWEFRARGKSGTPVSSLFPHVGEMVDDLAVIRSMTSDFSEHTNANYFIHSGSGIQGRPSVGSWLTYGLGAETRSLPGFVVINSGMIPPGGLDCFNSGFLPASYQGSLFQTGPEPVADLRPPGEGAASQRAKLDLLRRLDKGLLDRLGPADRVEAAINNYELAFRMQSAVPELCDLSGESEAVRKLYGLDQRHTETFGRQCILARRLVERGVRFVELLCPHVGHDRWDQHGNLKKGHEDNAAAVDQPIAALLKDLKARGLLESTLVVWGGEFGRTPMAQGRDGRDHNPFGFSIWLAGGGVKGGCIYGATDDYGYYAVQDKATIHDLHATILHLLGIDHTRLTYRFSGRDYRLTDVYGSILHPILK